MSDLSPVEQKIAKFEQTVSEIQEKVEDKASPEAGLLTDDRGKRSMMRLMSLLSLITAIWFGYLTIQDEDPSDAAIYITTGFLLGAFAPKALQKFVENAYPPKK